MEALETDALRRYVEGQVPVIDDLHAEVLYAAGHVFYEQSDYARAADVFRLLALARPHTPRSWIALGATHEAAGDLEPAMALYGIATQSRDGSPLERVQAFAHLARTEHLNGADVEARDDLDRANDLASEIELDEETASTLATLGALLNNRSRR
jgi:tetratricopeptide (TPR) repeat protein